MQTSLGTKKSHLVEEKKKKFFCWTFISSRDPPPHNLVVLRLDLCVLSFRADEYRSHRLFETATATQRAWFASWLWRRPPSYQDAGMLVFVVPSRRRQWLFVGRLSRDSDVFNVSKRRGQQLGHLISSNLKPCYMVQGGLEQRHLPADLQCTHSWLLFVKTCYFENLVC